jgi:AI-2 transport protein TqsA
MSETTDKGAGALISVAAVIIIIYGMQAAKVLLVPFLMAVFFAMIAMRPMLWLLSRRIPSMVAALLVVTLMMFIIAIAGTILGSSIADFTAALPTYQARLDTMVQGGLAFVARFVDDPDSIKSLGDIVDPGWAMGFAATILNGLRDVLTNTFLILFTMVFILLEASSVGIKAQAAFGRSSESFAGPRIFLANLGRYLGIKTLISVVTGLTAGIMTWIIGLDFPLLWGMLAFLLNYVPTIGSIIAAVPTVLMALVQLGLPEATTTAIGFLAMNTVYGNMIEPRLMGYGVGISPLIVFVGLVFWGWVFGPVGMLLSVPLTMTLKLALESEEQTRWIAILIGSEKDAEHWLQKRQTAA